MPKILVVHGPNLNLLGVREPHIYGSQTLEDINALLLTEAGKAGAELRIVQSNYEGELIEHIQKAINWADAIILNPAGYTHTSVALRDAIVAVRLPTIEVHLSNIWAREEWREKSVTAPACVGVIAGFQATSYLLALRAALSLVERGAR